MWKLCWIRNYVENNATEIVEKIHNREEIKQLDEKQCRYIYEFTSLL